MTKKDPIIDSQGGCSGGMLAANGPDSATFMRIVLNIKVVSLQFMRVSRIVC